MTRILACSVGLTPQIVTESLWALAVASQPLWLPDRLAIITTGSGARLAHETLVHPQRGAIARLGRAYGRPEVARLADHAEIRVIHRRGIVVEDVTNAESVSAADEAAYEFVRDLTSPATSKLRLVIAGGRKSLSIVLGIAMSLCGRACDQMSHVLVDQRWEARSDFFFPDPGDDEAAAAISLHIIPFPRLRSLADPRTQKGALADQLRRVQARIDPPTIRIRRKQREILVGDQVVRLTPTLIAWVSALAEDGLTEALGLPRVGLPRTVVERHLRIATGSPTTDWPDPLDPEQTQEWTSRLNKLVAPCLRQRGPVPLVIRTGRYSASRYVLNASREQIFLE